MLFSWQMSAKECTSDHYYNLVTWFWCFRFMTPLFSSWLTFVTPFFFHALCTRRGVVRFRFCDWPFSYWIFIGCANYVWMRFYDLAVCCFRNNTQPNTKVFTERKWRPDSNWCYVIRSAMHSAYLRGCHTDCMCVNTHTPSVSSSLKLSRNNDILWGTQTVQDFKDTALIACALQLVHVGKPCDNRRTCNSSAPISILCTHLAVLQGGEYMCKNDVIAHS